MRTFTRIFEMPRTREADDCVLTGSHKQGELIATYKKLVEVFGEPNKGDEVKTNIEWVVNTPDGLATIYDYKNDDPETIYWYIGGFRPEVVAHITNYYNDNTL